MRVLAWKIGVIFTSPAAVEKVWVCARAVMDMPRVRSSTVFMQDIVGSCGG
jgi:hypothetical protein